MNTTTSTSGAEPQGDLPFPLNQSHINLALAIGAAALILLLATLISNYRMRKRMEMFELVIV